MNIDAPHRSQAKVLIVEDDYAMRALLVEEVTAAGFSVLDAASGSSALQTITKQSFDLVITDLRMPGIDGFDLIRDIKALPDSPHIIMVTAFGSIETAIRAVKLGAYDYITKPFEIEELILIADKALEERYLRKKVERLQEEVETKYSFHTIIGESENFKQTITLTKRLAPTAVSVLLTGESGTGKELLARALHYHSTRAHKPFVAVNLGAIPANLIESELFGHTKGAFTDATSDRRGMFGEAHEGTLFLDEIGELPVSMQATLLRVLQEKEIRPLGASTYQTVDVRIIAATNRDLVQQMATGEFREDLYYRINVVEIGVPPLRKRQKDILLLSEHFLRERTKTDSVQKTNLDKLFTLSKSAKQCLLQYSWPGNVRELENAITHAATLTTSDEIQPEDFPDHIRNKTTKNTILQHANGSHLTLAELERAYIHMVLADEGGHKTNTAKRLGLDRKTLYRKLEEYAKNTQEP